MTDKRLKQRFKQQSKLKAATRFDSDFAHAYARQAFLEVYKPEMKAKAQESARFAASLELGGNGVGHGFYPNGSRAHNITLVAFVFEYSQGAWREVTGFPTVKPRGPLAHLLR